jgi:hypothetical protein
MSSIQELSDFQVAGTYAGQAAAANTTLQLAGLVMPWKGTVKGVVFVPSAAITANVTNFSILTIQNRGPLLSGVVAMASRTWAAVNSVAGVAEAFTLNATAANLEVAAGDNIQVAQTSGAAGLLIPPGTFYLILAAHR